MEAGDVTTTNAIGLGLTLTMCCLLLILPRRNAMFPILFLTCFMPMTQKIVIGGFDFTMIRILVAFGWMRLFVRGETAQFKFTAIDRALLWWAASGTIVYCLLWGTSGAIINRLGHAYDTLGLYFLFRQMIRTREDMNGMIRTFAFCIVPLALCIIHEKMTGTNIFVMFTGGSKDSVIRDGVIRCQGPFAHPILAGTFGATSMPLFVGLWWKRHGSSVLPIMGVAACAVITVASGSSGPVMAFASAVIAFVLWPMRRRMRILRWGIVLSLLVLQMCMKAPVWFLMARVNVFDGSGGFFRAYLIDSAVRNLSDWWLMGTQSTAKWGLGLFDVTNEYIAQGVDGGLITMVLFILIICRSFSVVGRAACLSDGSLALERLQIWALGAALVAHVITYFSVSYFDQNIVAWFLLLALISWVAEMRRVAVGREASPRRRKRAPMRGSNEVPSEPISV